MFKTIVFRRFFLPTCLVVCLFLTGGVGYSLSVFKEKLLEIEIENLTERARLASLQAKIFFPLKKAEALQTLTEQWEGAASYRFTVAGPSGRVLADSQKDPGRLENQSHLPEFQKARAGEISSSLSDKSIDSGQLISAAAVEKNGEVVGVVLVRAESDGIMAEWAEFTSRLYFVLGAFIFILMGVLWRKSRLENESMQAMEESVNRFSQGDLSIKLPENGGAVIDPLLHKMNRMAKRIDGRIRTVLLQKNEVEAVLFSMSEGVLAVDADEKILRVNRAATDLFGIDGDNICGRRFHEIFRNSKLKKFILRTLESSDPVEDQFTVMGEKDCFIHAHGAALVGADSKRIGALVVLNDVTKLRKLENMRRDFVANVSHELKTPITSIKGFVETLLQDDFNDPEAARRFLEIIMKQTSRLNVIIDDLLSLSRMESEMDRVEISRDKVRIRELLQSAIQDCAFVATEGEMEVELACNADLVAHVNWPLLEEAVVNLIQNGLKYGKSGKKIRVSGEIENNVLIVSVQDWGPGIETTHLPRLFERFYRVDAARSRNLGGSGLGLAIVKHIAQAHNGTVSVQSTPGRGSQFIIRIDLSQFAD
jgi:two-component system, OmpR family, phosphate regulon sensor histidine kinase PhoR